jgi:hypothetical protein
MNEMSPAEYAAHVYASYTDASLEECADQFAMAAHRARGDFDTYGFPAQEKDDLHGVALEMNRRRTTNTYHCAACDGEIAITDQPTHMDTVHSTDEERAQDHVFAWVARGIAEDIDLRTRVRDDTNNATRLRQVAAATRARLELLEVPAERAANLEARYLRAMAHYFPALRDPAPEHEFAYYVDAVADGNGQLGYRFRNGITRGEAIWVDHEDIWEDAILSRSDIENHLGSHYVTITHAELPTWAR